MESQLSANLANMLLNLSTKPYQYLSNIKLMRRLQMITSMGLSHILATSHMPQHSRRH